jgi:starch synthase
MNILIISAEVAPFAKVGGLADVAGALPKALCELGHDVRVVMPCYKMVEANPDYAVQDLYGPFSVTVRPGEKERAFVRTTAIHSRSGDIPVLLVGNVGSKSRPGHFAEATDSTKVYSLSPEPYVFFCRAVIEMLRKMKDEWRPDILHCNDWQSGLIPVLARTEYRNDPVIAGASTQFTIHNLAYQGNFDRHDWHVTGLSDSLYSVDALEFYGGWSFMKGALMFSDRINTVSETYAKEIRTPEYGCGLDGLMETLARTGRLSGILNGIDFDEYNPETDPRIPSHFSAQNTAGKRTCKDRLQDEIGLARDPKVPLIGLVSRLADQKGLDLIHAIVEPMLGLPVQFALLGTGDKSYEAFFRRLQERNPGQMHARIGFDTDLAQRIYAGCDLFLMPSRFEPCGLGQMMALRYGTIPIVRATGGLADSIRDYGSVPAALANGFVFGEYSPDALLGCVREAVALFRQPAPWKRLVRRAMQCDFSWSRSAVRYEASYCDALAARRAGQMPLSLDCGERG